MVEMTDLIAKDAFALAAEAMVDALQQLLHLPRILLLQPARMQRRPVLLIPLPLPLHLIPQQVFLHATGNPRLQSWLVLLIKPSPQKVQLHAVTMPFVLLSSADQARSNNFPQQVIFHAMGNPCLQRCLLADQISMSSSARGKTLQVQPPGLALDGPCNACCSVPGHLFFHLWIQKQHPFFTKTAFINA